jgi:hypothetical protein
MASTEDPQRYPTMPKKALIGRYILLMKLTPKSNTGTLTCKYAADCRKFEFGPEAMSSLLIDLESTLSSTLVACR